MDFLLAFAGIAALIFVHELGHFAAAKAVGMRVERFSLFFGPMIVKFTHGETEYGVGVIPLGGYAKISGMSPEEELPPDVVARAYCNQPVWKRIVVVAAGPAVNIIVAFLLAWAILATSTQGVVTQSGQPVLQVASVQAGSPAAGALEPGDRIVAVDGAAATYASVVKEISADRCAGAQVDGCRGATAVTIQVNRDRKLLTLRIRPTYEASAKHVVVGFEFDQAQVPIPFFKAASLSGTYIWNVTTSTVSTVARIFEPKERRQLHSVVGIVDLAQQSVAQGPSVALQFLALISLALAIINLFPFLPLDGGHIFWAIVEKVRGRRVPLVVMERASLVGVVLIVLLVSVGLSNDVSALLGKGIVLPR